MGSDYYARNLDQLGDGVCQPAFNAVIDVLLSDQTASNASDGESVLTISAVGGEYSLQHDSLIGATIELLFRDGLNYYETENNFTMADKEFQFDSGTGTITYPPVPFPPLQPNEKTNILYIASGGAVMVSEPVTLEEAKAWLKVEVDDDDSLISALITAARISCEGYVNLSFVEREVTAILNNSLGNIRLPYGPVNNLTSVSDINESEMDYLLTGVSARRLLTPALPFVACTYTAGYLTLPQHFRAALKEQLVWLYQHRGDDNASDISPTAKIILNPHRPVV
jgi:uncharacterized phiE125 gp8 family phage protein